MELRHLISNDKASVTITRKELDVILRALRAYSRPDSGKTQLLRDIESLMKDVAE